MTCILVWLSAFQAISTAAVDIHCPRFCNLNFFLRPGATFLGSDLRLKMRHIQYSINVSVQLINGKWQIQ